MDHKRAMRANKSSGSTEEGNHSGGLHATDIVKGQRDWNRAKDVKQRDPIGYISASGLERQMDVSYPVIGGYGGGIPNAANGGLIDWTGEDAVDFIRRLGRLGFGSIGHVVSQMNEVARKSGTT
jgi:hypothetical protein